MDLQSFFNKNPRIAVAFSGGVDSSYLLYAAKTAGCELHAYTISSQFQPKHEQGAAKKIAALLGIPHTICKLDALGNPVITKNPPDRCYHCKRMILTHIWALALADGFDVLCDGTNADDDESDRPGMRALRELGVVSPLKECGLTKANIRRLSKEAGLETHNMPTYSCLATRIPSGTALTGETLTLIEHAEQILLELGFSDFRVRLLPPRTAKLQFRKSDLALAVGKRETLLESLRCFDDVLLDLKGR